MAILLNGWILPIGEVVSERVCSLRSRLAFIKVLAITFTVSLREHLFFPVSDT